MPTRKPIATSRTSHLSWLHGHLERVEPHLETAPDGKGYYLLVHCEMGQANHHHYLAPDPQASYRVQWQAQPYVWQTAVDAFAALDRLEQQQ